ncbi:hypothetical protein HN51_016043, partial [Arachis hypogaea]
NWEDEIELDGEVIELSYRGSYPWWQLLRGSVERSSARASFLYLPLFLVFTTMAFILFAEENVDIAVVEAGLGGARDAMNVISSSGLATSVITTVREEHLAALGGSLETIAVAKAGFIKQNRPIVGAENPVLMSAAEQIFSAVGKRMRPALVFMVSWATAELLGLKRSRGCQSQKISSLEVLNVFNRLWWSMLRHTPMMMRSSRKLKQWGSPKILKKKLLWKLLEP